MKIVNNNLINNLDTVRTIELTEKELIELFICVYAGGTKQLLSDHFWRIFKENNIFKDEEFDELYDDLRAILDYLGYEGVTQI